MSIPVNYVPHQYSPNISGLFPKRCGHRRWSRGHVMKIILRSVSSMAGVQVLGFEEWPYGDTPAIVMTRRGMSRITDHAEFYDGNLEELVRDVTGTRDPVWLGDGAALARNLIDEIRLSVIPILLKWYRAVR